MSVTKDYPQFNISSILKRTNNSFGFEDVLVEYINLKGELSTIILPYPKEKFNNLNEEERESYLNSIKNINLNG